MARLAKRPSGPNALLSVADVCREYASARTFHRMRRQGLIPAPMQVSPGSRGQRWYRREIEAALAATRRAA
jgi:hypothetical protein